MGSMKGGIVEPPPDKGEERVQRDLWGRRLLTALLHALPDWQAGKTLASKVEEGRNAVHILVAVHSLGNSSSAPLVLLGEEPIRTGRGAISRREPDLVRVRGGEAVKGPGLRPSRSRLPHAQDVRASSGSPDEVPPHITNAELQ
jgi:hypothetical protein